MLAEVVVKSFLLSRAENIFTYKIPKNIEEEISVGKRVIVPFGKGNKGTVGLIINILDEKDVETDIKFKEINMLIDEKEIVSKTQIKLAKFMSEKYITNLSYCLNCVLPPGDWSKIEEFFILNKEKSNELSAVESEFFSRRKNILEIREFYNDDKKVNYLIENEILVKKYKYNNSENKFLEKYQTLKEFPVTWHLIGTLQRRKVKEVIPFVDYFHALDSFKLAQEIQKRTDHVIKCFLQVNISGEESKHGFSKEELLELLPDLAQLDQIEYVGLMTMAPFEADSDELKQIFKKTQELQAEIREKQIPNMPMTELSMGMSRDYKEAIQFGSSFVRIGTAFFK